MPRSTRWVIVAVALAAIAPCTRADDDPEFNGRKMTEWMRLLKEDTTPRIRRAAAVALGQIGAENRPQLPIILGALGRALRNDAAPVVRQQAAAVLGQQKDESALVVVPDLTESLRVEKEPGVRREVATALGRYGKFAKPAVIPLTASLKDTDPAVRAAAADALGRIGADASAALPELSPLLKEKDKSVRQAAVFALGRIEPDDKTGPADTLIGMLMSETDLDIRRELVLALGFLGEKTVSVVASLAGVLAQDKDVELRREVVLILAKFGPVSRSAESELKKAFREDKDKLIRAYAVRALGAAYGTDSPQLITLLAEGLKADPDFEVRVAIAEELGATGQYGKAALPYLRQAQRDPQIKVREAATAALKQIERPAVRIKP
ncbi:HEAT repeat domain-containing protein [Fimbriiglobus ruber]|uniref:HEAT repeat protein n=1 Tax=Fimbriiglobus ruber TaxID=1908690 RepID=A0A225E6K7_9BACT|nr:HEAT repeat protein [Fimbriiglobus ruber]